MMDYVNENPDATVCMETEYPNREDGLVLLEGDRAHDPGWSGRTSGTPA